MQPTQNTYPVFEANQVLTNRHLNQVFDYLDEQERLTRANLIGIGIVCGLEIIHTGTNIHLSKGCGVTSQGYLIIEPKDVDLVAYKIYKLPADIEYPLFRTLSDNDLLWEMFPIGEPNATSLGIPANFLKDKAVLLFLELKNEGLRNCSPNNCDDKGAEVTATVRRLLIKRGDLDKLIANANQLNTDLTPADLEVALLARMNLPDLRLPRFDVPNTNVTTSIQLLTIFADVFQNEQLVTNTSAALTALYKAFLPVVETVYPSDPFVNFSTSFGFLDKTPVSTTQVKFLQYYYDFFDDLLKAYDEFRWKGLDLICACCPPAELFPRHLMLGLVDPTSVNNPSIYRHVFLSSSAISGCEEQSRELLWLFRRIVEMIAHFTNTPALPKQATGAKLDNQVRITPSKLADVPLSDKAIPYYYQQNGKPPLYQVWNVEKTRRGRANQNLSYRSDEYFPAPPGFVLQALRYDLEPHNFLRIEGHLGKNYQTVLRTLLELKKEYRLPIDIIALRTGAFDERQEVDLSKENCRFEDLETLYDTMKAELICFLCHEVAYFYNIPFEFRSPITAKTKPRLPILVACDPSFEVSPSTLGRLFEDWLASQPKGLLPDIDPNIIINFLNTTDSSQNIITLFYIIFYQVKIYNEITQNLPQFNFTSFEKRYNDLISVTSGVERERELAIGNIQGNVNLMSWEEIDDRLEDIIYNCQINGFKALIDEYKRRIKEVKQKQFLSYFLQNNPGIQHKAGVPIGGTFILVYHDDPDATTFSPNSFLTTDIFIARGQLDDTAADAIRVTSSEKLNIADTLSRISAKSELTNDQDVRELIGAFNEFVPLGFAIPPVSTDDDTNKIITKAINELIDGTIIADFFVPYICCSDCSPVQFVLPKIPPVFTVKINCTNSKNQAEVILTAEGGLPPYSVKVDTQNYKSLGNNALSLSAGSHTLTIKDAEGTESATQTIEIPNQLQLGKPSYDCIGDNNEYVVTFQISGGIPPYKASRGTVNGATYLSDALPVDVDTEIIITDKENCPVSFKSKHTCVPNLDFIANINCSDENGAPVKIVTKGGVPPYEARVGGAAFADVNKLTRLALGSNKIDVKDSSGQTATQTLVVPPPLQLTVKEFICKGTESYTATINITGGTPPYYLGGKELDGDSFTTGSIGNGKSFKVEVTDKNKCLASLEDKNTCPEPCDLPCGGVTKRCAYRLWIQPPNREIGNVYETYKPEGNSIVFSYNGQNITFPIDIASIPTVELNSNFNEAIERCIKRINEAISQKIGAGKVELTYAPNPNDAFATLLIEHFECETFSLEFAYSYGQPTPAYAMMVTYSNKPLADAPFDGAIFINRRLNNKQTLIPAFDCSTRKLCPPITNFEPLCTGPKPKLTLEIVRSADYIFIGKVTNMLETDIVAWIWDVPRGNEPFLQGQKVNMILINPRANTTVRLTAVTKLGCFAIAENKLPL